MKYAACFAALVLAGCGSPAVTLPAHSASAAAPRVIDTLQLSTTSVTIAGGQTDAIGVTSGTPPYSIAWSGANCADGNASIVIPLPWNPQTGMAPVQNGSIEIFGTVQQTCILEIIDAAKSAASVSVAVASNHVAPCPAQPDLASFWPVIVAGATYCVPNH